MKKTYKITGIPDTQIFSDMMDGLPVKSPEELRIRCVLAIYMYMQLERREDAEGILEQYVQTRLKESKDGS